MTPDQDLDEYLRASWEDPTYDTGHDIDPRGPAPKPKWKTIHIKRCLACALPIDAHNPRCAANPNAVNPLPWPAEFGPVGSWIHDRS